MLEYIKILGRTTSVFFILMLIIRLLGKREVGELSIFDLVILLIIADIASLGIDDEGIFLPSILCLVLLLILQKIFANILMSNSALRDFIDGIPKVLVKDGVINYQALRDEKYTVDDLINQVRCEGLMDVDEVRLAILETSGKLSVFSKVRYEKIVLPIVLSGRIDKNMSKELGLTEIEVKSLLKDNKLDLKDILYAVSDGENILSVKFSDDSSSKKN